MTGSRSFDEIAQAIEEQVRGELPPEQYAVWQCEWRRHLSPEKEAEIMVEVRRLMDEPPTPSADELAADLRRLLDDDEPQPATTTTESKAQGMTAAQARAELDAIARGTIAKD